MKQKPKIFYDKKVDALWIRIKHGPQTDAEEIAPGMTIEYNNKREIIGLEILNASVIMNTVKERKLEMFGSAHYA